MRSLDDSTLWRISAFEREQAREGESGFMSLTRQTTLPTTLHADLTRIDRAGHSGDAVEVVAACMRQRENALVLLRLQGLVWPLTLFPRHDLHHLPRPLTDVLAEGARDLAVLQVDPPGLRPPGDYAHERVGNLAHYRPLAPLLWALALQGPRVHLLSGIAGRAAYRLAPGFASTAVKLPGALGPALTRLQTEIAPLATIARWPGMDTERAVRLLNGSYLQGSLMVLRNHSSARDDATGLQALGRWWRNSRH
jgi:hypothetical protein